MVDRGIGIRLLSRVFLEVPICLHSPIPSLFLDFGADPDNSILGLSWDLCARADSATTNKTV